MSNWICSLHVSSLCQNFIMNFRKCLCSCMVKGQLKSSKFVTEEKVVVISGGQIAYLFFSLSSRPHNERFVKSMPEYWVSTFVKYFAAAIYPCRKRLCSVTDWQRSITINWPDQAVWTDLDAVASLIDGKFVYIHKTCIHSYTNLKAMLQKWVYFLLMLKENVDVSNIRHRLNTVRSIWMVRSKASSGPVGLYDIVNAVGHRRTTAHWRSGCCVRKKKSHHQANRPVLYGSNRTM